MNARKASQKGLGLIEAMVGVILITIIITIGVRLLSIEAELLLLNRQQRLAEEQIGAAVASIVAAHPVDNAAGLRRNGDGTITLLALQTGYYDYLVRPDEGNSLTLPAGCSAWPCVVAPSTMPTGTHVVLVRAWNVLTADSARNLRRILLAAFPPQVLDPSHQSTEALSGREFNVTFAP